MDEHDKRAREVMAEVFGGSASYGAQLAVIASALRSTAAAAVAAERERCASVADGLAVHWRGMAASKHLGDPAVHSRERLVRAEACEAVARAISISAAPLASPAQAERVSADLASAITWARTIHKGRAALLLAEAAERLTRIAARLRARADEWRDRAVQHGRNGESAWEGECYRVMNALRAEADALEVGT